MGVSNVFDELLIWNRYSEFLLVQRGVNSIELKLHPGSVMSQGNFFITPNKAPSVAKSRTVSLYNKFGPAIVSLKPVKFQTL